jgi:homoserine O-acetyltransferase
MPEAYETYRLGGFNLQRGEELPDAFIAYKTFGSPNLPAIVYPTWFSGREYRFWLPVFCLLTGYLIKSYPIICG